MSQTYPIHERFATFQGEGVHSGSPAFFIRTYGCPVHCPWCDSAGTWHPSYVPPNIARLPVERLVDEALLSNAPIVVITGGEPTILDLLPLVSSLQEAQLRVHLETSGGFKTRGEFDWVTLSPKKWRPPLPENIMLADEFKIIVEYPGDIGHYVNMLLAGGLPEDCMNPVWLHPEWSHRVDTEVLQAITESVKRRYLNFRAGWQLHKLYAADTLDKRSAVAVPLGGDPAKGASI